MAKKTSPPPDKPKNNPLPIVGVGASAGGFEAFQRLIENLPAGSPLAIVFIQHLLPTHKSMLTELLSKTTAMQVSQAEDGMPLETGHVYIIPPDVYIEVRDGRFTLAPRGGEGAFLPIDRFFISLATDVGERAIGVVLSGMGSDGAIGLRQIKEAGGVTFCQLPGSAERDEMPRAAMATGDADFMLSPAEIGRSLVELAQHPYIALSDERAATPDLRPSEEQFQRIFSLLRTSSGIDFAHYKRPTIERRLLRRMALQKTTSAADYLERLQKQPQEVNELYRDILIHVTFFFREPASFTTLSDKAFPKLFEGRRPDDAVRIWVPGCSSGEEPYSIAIALSEFLTDKADDVSVQIFATDVGEQEIELARGGLYPEPVVRPVSPERLRRYFTQVDGKYRINKKIRDMCVFARHDLTRDPPFSRLDLIVCRNVLIYLDLALQKRLFAAFHYALKSTGFLMLGSAESVGLHSDLFAVVDKKHRLYSKRAASPAPLELSFTDGKHAPRLTSIAPAPAGEHLLRRSVQQEVSQLLLNKYAPPGVLVNDRFEIVQFRGQTGYFIEPAPGEADLHVLKMVRPGLLYELQEALAEARKSQSSVRKEGLHVDFNGHGRDVNLQVMPVSMPDEPLHYLILFEDMTADGRPDASGRRTRAAPRKATSAVKPSADLEQLRRELETTRKYLQSAIQDLEITNEELQSANEEVLSSNEELQSTNEELDTAKEELQSTNEELNTLNAELHSRNEELSLLNSDLINLLSSVDLAVIMVDRGLCIRRFTPAAEKLFNLIPGDVGRPMQHIKPNIVYPELEQRIQQVIEKVAPLEEEIRDVRGTWYLLRVRPYCTIDNRIEGAVIVLLNVDTVRHGR
ncbi:MAG TPA: chemotaxis protein CheB [Pirellulales bacterium]|nr:chemotaxis protein CheB [Pirellulales bacterium]